MQTCCDRRGFGNCRPGRLAWLLLCAAIFMPLRGEAQILSVRKLTHVPRSVTGISLNDWGWAVWATGVSNSSQVYLWNGKTITPLGTPGRNSRFPVINNNNWIVWRADREDPDIHPDTTTDVFLSKGGAAPVNLTLAHDVASEPDINDRNEIVWSGEFGGSGILDIFLLRPGDTQATNMTVWDNSGASTGPQINNYGMISWERTTDVNPGGETNLVLAKVSDMRHYRQITNSTDLNVTNGRLSDQGKLVWYQYNDAKSKSDVWQFDPYGANMPENLSDPLVEASLSIFPLALSRDGTVAWAAQDTHGAYANLYWNRGRMGTQLIPIPLDFPANTKNIPIAINNTGGMIFASGVSSTTGYDIYLVQLRRGHLLF